MAKEKTDSPMPPRTDDVSAPVPKSKPSPGLTKDQIMKSLVTKPMGPVIGKPVVGAGGLKPFRPPPEGTKAVPYKVKPKVLRPPLAWSKE